MTDRLISASSSGLARAMPCRPRPTGGRERQPPSATSRWFLPGGKRWADGVIASCARLAVSSLERGDRPFQPPSLRGQMLGPALDEKVRKERLSRRRHDLLQEPVRLLLR